MMSLSMVAVLQRRLSPDEASFEVAASTTSTLLIVCGGGNIAFREYKLFIIFVLHLLFQDYLLFCYLGVNYVRHIDC